MGPEIGVVEAELGQTPRPLTLQEDVGRLDQPNEPGTALLGFAFLLSMNTKQPLVQRLARDFLPVSPDFFANPFVRRFFMRISLLWAMVMLANAAVTTWMLLQLPVSLFVISKTAASVLLTGVAIAYSTIWFRRLFSGAPTRA